MTQDEIIEMTKELGICELTSKPKQSIHYSLTIHEMEAFAKLVAAKERDHIAKYFEKETTHLFEVDGLWIGKTIRRIRTRGEA